MFATARKQSFSEMIQAATPDHIFLVRGEDEETGERCWYYVQVNRGKRDAFRARSGSPLVTLTDYGHILYSGYGENPPTAIQKRMEEEYGFKS